MLKQILVFRISHGSLSELCSVYENVLMCCTVHHLFFDMFHAKQYSLEQMLMASMAMLLNTAVFLQHFVFFRSMKTTFYNQTLGNPHSPQCINRTHWAASCLPCCLIMLNEQKHFKILTISPNHKRRLYY